MILPDFFFAVIEHREAYNRQESRERREQKENPVRHQLDGFGDTRVLPHRNQLLIHDVADLNRLRLESERDYCDHDVAVGDDTRRHAFAVRLVHDDNAAYVVFTHQLCRRLHGRVPARAHYLATANLSNGHVRCSL